MPLLRCRYGSHLSKEQVAELVTPHPETLVLVMDSRADVSEHAQGRARQKARGLRNRACMSNDYIYLDRKREDYLGMSEL